MRHLFRATLLTLSLTAVSGAALAQDAPKVTANIAVVSDYLVRGVSQTDEKPALQGGVDLGVGSFYAGAWASNVDFSPFGDRSTSAETDLYAGYRPRGLPVNLDLGVVYYGYLDQPKGAAELGYWEAKALVSQTFGPATIGAAAYWSPDFTGELGAAWYTEINAAYAPSTSWSVSGAVGHQQLKTNGDYSTWNLGATYAITPHLSADVRYYDTDHHGFGDVYGARGAVALKAVF
jgi:uncharacterized protein (TIGR02001 family)